MEDHEQDKDAPKKLETIDASRRKLLGSMGKAAWVAPTLVLLSSRNINADGPPPPPPPPPGSTEGFGPSTNSTHGPKRRNGSG